MLWRWRWKVSADGLVDLGLMLRAFVLETQNPAGRWKITIISSRSVYCGDRKCIRHKSFSFVAIQLESNHDAYVLSKKQQHRGNMDRTAIRGLSQILTDPRSPKDAQIGLKCRERASPLSSRLQSTADHWHWVTSKRHQCGYPVFGRWQLPGSKISGTHPVSNGFVYIRRMSSLTFSPRVIPSQDRTSGSSIFGLYKLAILTWLHENGPVPDNRSYLRRGNGPVTILGLLDHV